MNMPGFSAEASFYTPVTHYRTAGRSSVYPNDELVTPQLKAIRMPTTTVICGAAGCICCEEDEAGQQSKCEPC